MVEGDDVGGVDGIDTESGERKFGKMRMRLERNEISLDNRRAENMRPLSTGLLYITSTTGNVMPWLYGRKSCIEPDLLDLRSGGVSVLALAQV